LEFNFVEELKGTPFELAPNVPKYFSKKKPENLDKRSFLFYDELNFE
jgi:hypothetical protein